VNTESEILWSLTVPYQEYANIPPHVQTTEIDEHAHEQAKTVEDPFLRFRQVTEADGNCLELAFNHEVFRFVERRSHRLARLA
jgi:hypothetical protein